MVWGVIFREIGLMDHHHIFFLCPFFIFASVFSVSHPLLSSLSFYPSNFINYASVNGFASTSRCSFVNLPCKHMLEVCVCANMMKRAYPSLPRWPLLHHCFRSYLFYPKCPSVSFLFPCVLPPSSQGSVLQSSENSWGCRLLGSTDI